MKKIFISFILIISILVNGLGLSYAHQAFDAYNVKNNKEIQAYLVKEARARKTNISIDFSNIPSGDAYKTVSSAIMDDIFDIIEDYSFVNTKNVEINMRNNTGNIKVEFYENSSQNAQVESWIKSKMDGFLQNNPSTLEILEHINNVLIQNVSYDENFSGGTMRFSGYNAAILGSAVCQGYADLAKRMMDYAGIESFTIKGKVNVGSRPSSGGVNTNQADNHMWNVVKYNGDWKHIDFTWNDSTNQSKSYFLLDSSSMSRDHYWDAGLYSRIASSGLTKGNGTYVPKTKVVESTVTGTLSGKVERYMSGDYLVIKATTSEGVFMVEAPEFTLNNAGSIKLERNAKGNIVLTLLDSSGKKTNSNGLVSVYYPMPKGVKGSFRVKLDGVYTTFEENPKLGQFKFAVDFK